MTNERIRRLKFLNAVTIIYVVLVICANVMASKVISISGVLTDAGTLTYPFTFMIGDILAEVFGYKAARRVILLGFAANLFFAVFALVGTFLPSADPNDALALAYNALFSYNIRILTASFIAYIVGSLLNAASLIWIKKLTGDKWLFARTIGSTALGALADTVIFTVIAWAFTLGVREIFIMILSGYAVKMVFEVVIATPFDYFAAPRIKKLVEKEE